jgi:hypothetical protein
VQGRDHRDTTELHGVEGDVPAARMVHAFACIAFFEFRQVQTGAEVVPFAMDDGGAGLWRQVLEDVTQGFNQCVAQGVAFGGTAQAHNGDGAFHLQDHAMRGRAFNQGVQV